MPNRDLESGSRIFAELTLELRAAKTPAFRTGLIPEASSYRGFEKIPMPELELEWAANGESLDFYLRREEDRWLLAESPEDLRVRVYRSIADVMVRRYYLKQAGA